MDYSILTGRCNNCNEPGINLVQNGYRHTDLQDNAICIECYSILKEHGRAKRFLASWLNHARPLCMDIYD